MSLTVCMTPTTRGLSTLSHSQDHTPFIFHLVLPIYVVTLFLCWIIVVWTVEHILYARQYLHDKLTQYSTKQASSDFALQTVSSGELPVLQ